MMALGPLAFLALLWASKSKKTAAPSPMPAPKPGKAEPPPWPQAIPKGLPAFPGPGWVPDSPPSAGVSARALALLPVLWRRGEGSWKTEHTRGRWITYQAAWHGPGRKGVNAWRLTSEPPVVVPEPEPEAPEQVPAPAPSPAPAETPAAPGEPAPAPEVTPAVSPRRELGAKLIQDLAGKKKGTEDRALVDAYEKAAGIVETGSFPMYGPAVAHALASDGFVPPSPLYWPSPYKTAVKAVSDWKAYAAQQAALEADPIRRAAWEESGKGAKLQPVAYPASNLQQAAAQLFFTR